MPYADPELRRLYNRRRLEAKRDEINARRRARRRKTAPEMRQRNQTAWARLLERVAAGDAEAIERLERKRERRRATYVPVDASADLEIRQGREQGVMPKISLTWWGAPCA